MARGQGSPSFREKNHEISRTTDEQRPDPPGTRWKNRHRRRRERREYPPSWPSSSSNDESIERSILNVGTGELLYPIESKEYPGRLRASVLHLGTLNRMLIHALQVKMAKIVKRVYDSPEQLCESQTSGELSVTMVHYCQALQNMEYMREAETQGYDKDPFKIKTDWTIQRKILRQTGLLDLVLKHPNSDLPICRDEDKPKLIGGSRFAANKYLTVRQRWERLLHAFGGGLALVVPMIIMVYVPGTEASIITTVGFIFIFGLIIALFSTLSANDVLSVTAAYAAVLVVFVGVH